MFISAASVEASPFRPSTCRAFSRSDLDSLETASPARYGSFRANVVGREISPMNGGVDRFYRFRRDVPAPGRSRTFSGRPSGRHDVMFDWGFCIHSMISYECVPASAGGTVSVGRSSST
jgi:hypothetical protein